MSNEKGKGKEISQYDKETSKSESQPGDQTLLSRVAASASGLTRSTFANPNDKELNNHAAAALSNTGGKNQAARVEHGSSTWAESSKSAFPPLERSANIRSGHHDEHVRQSENEFSEFLDGIDVFVPSQNSVQEPSSGIPENSMHKAWNLSRESHVPLPKSRTVEEQKFRDGEDVLALLADPSAMNEQFEAIIEDEDNQDWGLSPEQMFQLQAMTEELFTAPPIHGAISSHNPLNLNLQNDNSTERQIQSEMWREQWESVLTRYTDEVWGGLLPLVKEAQAEIEAMRNVAPSPTKPTALRRLEAVLGHLQKQ